MNRRNFMGALLALPVFLQAQSQGKKDRDENDSAARDHFFRAEDWTGFRLSILLRRETADKPCVLKEVASDAVLRSGDRIQLRIQPNAAGSLYVLAEDQDGNHRLLDTGSAGAFQAVMMPEIDWLRFDNEPGIDPVVVLFSRQPIAKLEALHKKDAVLSAREMHRLIAAQAADTQQRETEEAHNGSIPAIFSVAQFDNDTDLIMERIEFTHRPARKKG